MVTSKPKIIIGAFTAIAAVLAILFWLGLFKPNHPSTSVVMISPMDLSSGSEIIDCFNFDRIASDAVNEQARASSIAQDITNEPNLQAAISRYRLDELSELDKAELIEHLHESTTIEYDAEKDLWSITTNAITKELAEQYGYAIIITYKCQKNKEAIKRIDELHPLLAKEIELSQANLENYKILYAQALKEENRV